ncbi:DUF255 domain-containing protein [bacterium SCSIO 12741]|nr:DUF255 domain-containing protein [bacterium SCSIO 12741]
MNLAVYAQENQEVKEQPAGIKWMTIQEAEAAVKVEPKKIFIDLYTDWCGWCKRMDATTFKDPAVIEYMHRNYYSVKFDAESPDTLIFNNYTFYNLAQPGQRKTTHLFAYSLLDGKTTYPSYAILDENLNRINVFAGYQKTTPFLATIMYFGTNQYQQYHQFLIRQIQQQMQQQSQGAPAQGTQAPAN